MTLRTRAVLWLLTLGSLALGCDDTPPVDFPPPGLVIITPRVGVGANEQTAILLRAERPSRVTVIYEEDTLGTGRAGRDVTALRFFPPDVVSGGSTATVQVVAVSEGGMLETSEVTLVGLGQIEVQPLAQSFDDIAAFGSTAVLSTSTQLFLTALGRESPTATTVTGEIQAITGDEDNGRVIVAGAGAEITEYTVSSGSLAEQDSYELADYDGPPPQDSVSNVRGLDVDGSLLAAATAKGMAIVDRSVSDPDPYCRKRSTMSTKLKMATFDPAMEAVAVRADTERVIAGGEYLNVYEPVDDTDDGTCTTPMSNRGTSVIADPEDRQRPWLIVAIDYTPSFLWIGRQQEGLFRAPSDFTLISGQYFVDEDIWRVNEEALPLPVIRDLDATSTDRIWVALSDEEELQGGLVLVGIDGLELWVDQSALGGLPQALDVSQSADRVWVLTKTSVAAFTLP